MITFEYATVTEAINELSRRGYTIDFNLPEHVQKFESGAYSPSDFRIAGVYRYEGETDPADEAVVYALESKAGLKGLLVSGYGSAAGRGPAAILKKLRHYVP